MSFPLTTLLKPKVCATYPEQSDILTLRSFRQHSEWRRNRQRGFDTSRRYVDQTYLYEKVIYFFLLVDGLPFGGIGPSGCKSTSFR